jgi:hypothetical protein
MFFDLKKCLSLQGQRLFGTESWATELDTINKLKKHQVLGAFYPFLNEFNMARTMPPRNFGNLIV